MLQWQSFAKLINDPLLIFLLSFYALLGWIIFKLLQTISNQITYERQLISELNETSKTVVRLTTLIETLVHGKGGPK